MREIELVNGGAVIVDGEWFVVLNKWSWHLNNKGYAVRRIGPRKQKQTIYMHRYICMVPDAYQVDHINNNPLDCREDNLRIVLPEKNYYNRPPQANNTSGYKGVCYDKMRGKYMASISCKGHQRSLGRYNTPEEAAEAYNKAAIELHGEYAWLNDV